MIVLATGEVWTNPIIVGLIVGIPTSLLGYKAYRRAEALDKAAAQAATIAASGDAVQRVIDGLDHMVNNLQVDNREVRARASDLGERLKECRVAYDELKRMTASSAGP
jgi:predicted ATP-grasp superfamily ATP-dependent carboligase